MTSDALQFIQWFFDYIWRFFTDWKIPGTNMTPAGWFFFLIVSGLVLTFIVKMLGTSWFNGR